MASFVSIQDVVAVAVEIEKKGYAFYQEAKNSSQSKELADFFEFMANEEKKHESIFSAMYERVGALKLPIGSSEDEFMEYVGILIDSHSILAPGAAKKAMADPIGQATALEKDTILFFMTMKRLVPESEQKHVDECIAEEKKHLRLLAEKAKQLKL